MPSAREIVYDVILQWSREGDFVSDLLDKAFRRHNTSPVDRRFANEIACGIVRRQATLDAILRPHVSRGLENVEEGLRRLLHLGVYQLLFLSGVPDHAAVHETVELAKKRRRPQWTGVVNGILRSVIRNLTEEATDTPSARAIPMSDGRYRIVTADTFPAPDRDLVGYLADAFSFPRWLPQRWQVRLPSADLLALGFWFNSVPVLTLRVNSLSTQRDVLLNKLQSAGVAAQPGTRPESIRLEGTARVEELPGFAEGEMTVQDESAMGAAHLVAPQPGERILDLCAAPGGKTTHLAELMGNQGQIVAADVSEDRLKLVTDNCRRLGISNVESQLLDRNAPTLSDQLFDAILIDAPCSNTGVLGKRPEARWRLNPEEIAELQELQLKLLDLAVQALKPGGRIIYSTCSIEREENRVVVDAVLGQHSGLKLDEERLHIPGQPADGGYQARLVSSD